MTKQQKQHWSITSTRTVNLVKWMKGINSFKNTQQHYSLTYSTTRAITSVYLCAKLLQLCPTLCDSVDCIPPGSSVHGILQARILEWVAMPSSRGFSWPRDQTCISCISCRFFTVWATREVLPQICHHLNSLADKRNFSIILIIRIIGRHLCVTKHSTWKEIWRMTIRNV